MLYISKKKVNRRTLLQGTGVALMLPYLSAMSPALSQEITATQRFGFIYTPHGVILDDWIPTTTGSDYKSSPILSSLDEFRDQMTIYSGMRLNTSNTVGSGHATSSATWLSGAVAKDTSGSDIEAGKTIDQYISDQISQDTPLPSIEMGIEDVGHMIGSCDGTSSCGYINSISWKTKNQTNPMEINPRTIFERMFGIGSTAVQRLQRSKTDKSILDSIVTASQRMESQLGPRDKNRLDEFLTTVREVERRVGNLETRLSEGGTNLSAAPVEIPELYEEHVDIMLDLMYLAFQTDTTRVSSMMLSRELNQRTYPQIGVPEQHHGVSHHGYNPERQQLHSLINTYHVSLFSKLVSKLRNTEDFGGTMLDNTTFLYGAGMGDGNVHSKDPLSNIIVGGLASSHGQHIDMTQSDGTPIPQANLLRGVLQYAGVEVDALGDSTGIITL